MPRSQAQRWDKAEVKARANKALAMRLAGMTYQQIADAGIGFNNQSSVQSAVTRELEKQVSTNAQAIKREEVARCDSMIRSFWPKAKEGNVKAAGVVDRFMEKKARLLGLNFLDGVVERHVQVQEAQVRLAAEIVRRVLADAELGLTPEQQAVVPQIAQRHLAIEAMSSDDNTDRDVIDVDQEEDDDAPVQLLDDDGEPY
jgi:hypothetical protein